MDELSSERRGAELCLMVHVPPPSFLSYYLLLVSASVVEESRHLIQRWNKDLRTKILVLGSVDLSLIQSAARPGMGRNIVVQRMFWFSLNM